MKGDRSIQGVVIEVKPGVLLGWVKWTLCTVNDEADGRKIEIAISSEDWPKKIEPGDGIGGELTWKCFDDPKINQTMSRYAQARLRDVLIERQSLG
jgi:hypothetical protein